MNKFLIKLKPILNALGYFVIVITLISTYLFYRIEEEVVGMAFGVIMLSGLFLMIPLYIIRDLLGLVNEKD